MKPLLVALAGAFALHAAAAASIAALGLPHGVGHEPAVAGQQTIDIEQEPIVPVVRVKEPLPIAPTTAAISSRGTPHAQPTQAAPSVATVASPTATDTAPEPAPTEAPTAPVHFAMTMSARAGTLDGNARAASALQEQIARDEDVTVRARQIGGALPAYPPEALAQGVELSAPIAFEIVVDASGRVTSARELRHVGYGFDEAADAALRNFRFSPAQRGGRAVAVRMRWTVDFRLN